MKYRSEKEEKINQTSMIRKLNICFNENRSKKSTTYFIKNLIISNKRSHYNMYAQRAQKCQELLCWCRLYAYVTIDTLQMKLYAKSIGRIRTLMQNKKVLHRSEISYDSMKYTVPRTSSYGRIQYASQPCSLDEADSLAFLRELFGSK